jgi:type II secretory pathway pseudopilin PulG
MTRPRGRAEAGFSLVGALAGITVMLTLMGMAMPAWRYVMKDDREEELIFRGSQIADAIARCQRETKALPVSLDFLVKRKFLRKAYADPMTKHGKWRLIHPGEPIPAPLGFSPVTGGAEKAGERSGRGGVEPEGIGKPGPGAPPGISIGPILGVASTSKEKSLRLFNGRSRYDQWIFTVGMPRIVGRMPLKGDVPKPEAPARKPRY